MCLIFVTLQIVHDNGEVARPRMPIKRSQKPGSPKPGSQKPGSQKPGSQKHGSQKHGSQKPGNQKTCKKGSTKNGKEWAKKNQDTTRSKELRKSTTDHDTYGPIPVMAGPYLDVVRRSAADCESVLPSAQENATLAPGAMELRTGPGGPGAHPRNHCWSNPAENVQACGTSYHICCRPLTDYPVYAHDYTLPRAKDKHQDLYQDESLKRDPSPQGVSLSVTDLDLCNPNRSTSFGRFDGIRQPSPARLEENVTKVTEESGCESSDQTKQGSLGKKMKAISLTMRRKMGKKHFKTFSEEAGEDTDRDLEEETESSPPVEKGSEETSNSLESLCSGQSSSSSGGLASVSDGSSTRDSLRLEEDGSYNGHFCGRARVHTDFFPSPYDTDSLKLKVGDIISIISKPPMGIWTGILNNKVGNFKFIYVDMLMEKEREEEAPKIRPQRMSKRPRPKTLLELLERLHLEEYASALLLNGYQTVEDLRHLQEKHLIELNVMNPEHRVRLLAAVDCRYTESDDVRESEEPSSSHSLKVEKSDCPRDSGCFILSECSENSKEDTESQPVTH
uniref:SAM domain, SH3 domain and nuclear localisation signals 1a n=1 Tax=Oncorhynchus kisutch TaxID=8019 RepID=A0A8C7IKI0_ONCKI